MHDFLRHRMDVELECRCGHKATLDARMVSDRFDRNKWYTGLGDGYSMGAPHTHFYCTRCYARGRGKVRPTHIGPWER
jgi:hypothetical protein